MRIKKYLWISNLVNLRFSFDMFRYVYLFFLNSFDSIKLEIQNYLKIGRLERWLVNGINAIDEIIFAEWLNVPMSLVFLIRNSSKSYVTIFLQSWEMEINFQLIIPSLIQKSVNRIRFKSYSNTFKTFVF